MVAATVVVARTVARGPGPTFPASPTASRITVGALPPAAVPSTTFPLTDTQLRAALAEPPSLGALADPGRRASCLTGLRRATDLPVLGGRTLEVAGRPAVVMLLPGATPDQLTAVAVEASCSTVRPGLLAETTLRRR